MNTEADSALIEGEWGKSVGEAYLLWVLLACHRIYLGRPVSGVLQIVTLVALVVLVMGGKSVDRAPQVAQAVRLRAGKARREDNSRTVHPRDRYLPGGHGVPVTRPSGCSPPLGRNACRAAMSYRSPGARK